MTSLEAEKSPAHEALVRSESVLPEELSIPISRYLSSYQRRIDGLDDHINRSEHAKETVENAVFRNNKMSDILESSEYQEVQQRTSALLGDCKLGVVCCIDGRLTVPLMFGTSADVSKQMAAVLPTDISPDTGKITIDSSTVRVAVVKAPTKEDPNLLQLFVAHATSGTQEEDSDSHLESNCAAVKLIKQKQLDEGKDVNRDLIQANFDFLDDAIEAVTRTYNSAAEMAERPQLDKVAVRIVYDTESMGFVLNYGEEQPIVSSDLTRRYTRVISQLASRDARFQNPGALRFSYTDERQYISNEIMMLDIIELLMSNENFINEIDVACDESATTELCGLNESQRRGLQYIMARNVALQYLTGVHLEHLSQKEFDKHKEQYMSIARDDGHGMVVGGMDPRSQTFSAVTARVENAVEHIRTMAALMEHHHSPKPFVLFISEGIEEYGSDHPGSLDSVTSRVDNIYKEVQKDERIAHLVQIGNLIMIPVIQSSRTGRIVHIAITPLV